MISIQDLRVQLYAEHKRDIRLTIMRNALALVAIMVVVALIYYLAFAQSIAYFQGMVSFFDSSQNPGAGTYKLIVSLVFTSLLIYWVYDVVKQFQRPKEIEAFIAKIEEGCIGADIADYRVYKIVIPLPKIKFKLSPITFISVVFSQERKIYRLPIQSAYIPDVKTYLSGVERSEVRKAWYELYDGETTTSTETDKLNSIQEFRTFVKNELAAEIDAIENARKKSKSIYYKALVPGILIALGYLIFNLMHSSGSIHLDSQTLIIGFVSIAVLFYLIMHVGVLRPRQGMAVEQSFDTQFKTKVFNKLVQYINPKFRYIMHGHIDLPEFLEMGFFEQKHYDLTGNDQIMGKHSGVPFQLCDLQVQRERQFTREDEAPDMVFSGQVFIAKFHKTLKGEVYVISREVDGKFYASSDIRRHLNHLGEKVRLEDPEFMKMFEVYATDQVEARYVLSSSLMERIKNLAKADKRHKLMISFRNNRISLIDNSLTNNFELSMFKSITKNEQVVAFYETLCAQLRIIDDLKLNINIWKREV
ncbi:MAG: hypothetical protein CSA95_07385 [Bacteroidetes bacterium]|nr:MAG: hypothetical protein CSA95_07385 [Bacteroidota bacterium]